MEVHTKSTALRGSNRIHKELTYLTGKQQDIPKSQKTAKLDRKDILATAVVVPSEYQGNKRLGWARNQESLAFAIEHGGLRVGKKVAMIHQGTLPSDLNHAQVRKLTRNLTQEISDDLGVAVVYAVHKKQKGRAITRHIHAVTTARQVGPNGVGAKAVTELSRAQQEKQLGGTVAAYFNRKLQEKIAAAYKAAGKEVPQSVNSGEASASTEGLFSPKEYKRVMIKQANALARAVRGFAGEYNRAAVEGEEARAGNSKSGRRIKAAISSEDREQLAKKFGLVAQKLDRLDQTMVNATQAGGFGKTGEKRRYAPQAAELREKQSTLTPAEEAREKRRMEKMRAAGDNKEVIKQAVKDWRGAVKSGKAVNMPQIMNKAMSTVAGRNQVKDRSPGR